MGRTAVGKKRPRKVIMPMDIVSDRTYKRAGPVTTYKLEEVLEMENGGVVQTTITSWEEFLKASKDERRRFLEEHADESATAIAVKYGAPSAGAVYDMRKRLGLTRKNGSRQAKCSTPSNTRQSKFTIEVVEHTTAENLTVLLTALASAVSDAKDFANSFTVTIRIAAVRGDDGECGGE